MSGNFSVAVGDGGGDTHACAVTNLKPCMNWHTLTSLWCLFYSHLVYLHQYLYSVSDQEIKITDAKGKATLDREEYVQRNDLVQTRRTVWTEKSREHQGWWDSKCVLAPGKEVKDRAEGWVVAFSPSRFYVKEVTTCQWMIIHMKCSLLMIFSRVPQIQLLHVRACGTQLGVIEPRTEVTVYRLSITY